MNRLIKEPSPRWYLAWLLVAVLLFGWAWWNRYSIEATALCLFAGMAAFFAGMAFFGWLRAKGY